MLLFSLLQTKPSQKQFGLYAICRWPEPCLLKSE
uniref:Uncharacterized protein n=1 Tax=Nelumbo nucifera TaxID=4432 RepID=A0A822ZRZ8_NELNU|nr:TPA_asm: hypothetical protein HUJ06_017580 [Nelumbo nucifera]